MTSGMMRANVQGTLHVGTQEIYWAEYGVATGKPLLLIHGASGHVFPMQEMTALAGQNLRIIEMHQRGIGASRPQNTLRDNTIENNLNDIEALRRYLDIPEWSILSWSFGATLMAGYAFANPDRCSALISYAPFLGSQEDYNVLDQKKPDAADIYFTAQGSRDARVIAQKFYENARSADIETRMDSYYNAQKVWTPDLDKATLLQSKTLDELQDILHGRAVSAGHYHELFNEKNRFLEKMAQENGPLPVPATLIYGTDDGWSDFNSYADLLLENKKVCYADGAGHAVNHPAAQQVLKQELALL